MEKILITGAAGFLGRQLSDFLEKKKIQTVDVDDLSVRPLLKPKKKLIKMKVENISEGFLKKKINHDDYTFSCKKKCRSVFL